MPRHLATIFAAFIAGILLLPVAGPAAETTPAAPLPHQAAAVELTTELDAYYTDLGLHIPLSAEAIPDIGTADELAVYQRLLANSLTPRFLLLEASVFPMPFFGTYLKKNHRGFYDGASMSDDMNLIASITAGFQEPYSFSVFFGDVITFIKTGEKRDGANKGYMGYLFTFADKHIKDNTLINDKSLEIEWKMKGERNFTDEKLSWSFRLGSKIHDNRDIVDVFYLGLRRSNLDFNSPVMSWLKNSSFDLRWDFGLRRAGIMRQEYIVGKRLPLKNYNLALKFDFGLIWQNSRSYSGSLRDRHSDNLTLVFRPNIQF